MSHHGSNPWNEGSDPSSEARKNLMKSLLDTASFRGATHHFPDGKLTKSDEGGVQFGIGVEDGKVVLDFGTPVAWIGMTPQQAADLASTLLKRAREAGAKAGQPVDFIIR